MSDLMGLKRRFVIMLVLDVLLLCAGGAFAAAHFLYGLSWGLWAFIGLVVAAFVVQLWFVGGVGRMNKGI